MGRIKAPFVITVFNEQDTIKKFIKSVFNQSQLPDELIIVDGGSTDKTIKEINDYRLKIKESKIKFKVITKRGNRSVGRNEAIKNAKGEIILCSDAGCILDRNWVKNITKPFKNESVDVVAGYYRGKSKNIFQKCLIPYVLVMPDKVNPADFLPATRSMAFKKKIWEEVGGFDEKLNHNEDYAFAKKLKKANAKITFARNALVSWIPRTTFLQAFVMFFRFALGDAESGIYRRKVAILFLRYFFLFYLVFLFFLFKSLALLTFLLICIFTYIAWSIYKNFKYINEYKAFFILPVLQLTSDIAVLGGTTSGILKSLRKFNIKDSIINNKYLVVIILIYFLIELIFLRWGAPNASYPFPYHMDEWHQLNAVRATFAYGTPNVPGAANGTMFHFILSGLYLVPFVLINYIDPAKIAINDFILREKIFDLLRISTIFWGIASIYLIHKISKFLNVSSFLSYILLISSPIFLILSGYFKYDIALIFWLLMAFYFILRFARSPTNYNFLIASLPCAIAVAVKVSALPIVTSYILSYFMFTKQKSFKYLILGLIFFAILLLIFGTPDLLFGKGNIYNYLYNNIIETPSRSTNLKLGMDSRIYLYFIQFPQIFGLGFVILFLSSVVTTIYLFFKNGLLKSIQKNKIIIFTFFTILIFLISTMPLKIYGGGNRSLVLLPFMVIFISLTHELFIKSIKNRTAFKLFIFLMFLLQLFTSFSWLLIKASFQPQYVSSKWILENIKKDTVIGIENIPIYQFVPNIVQKEFYYSQNKVNGENKYKYQIINSDSSSLPTIVIITNDDVEKKLMGNKSKVSLLERLDREGFERIETFSPDFRLYKFIGKDKDFYLANILTLPTTISIYQK